MRPEYTLCSSLVRYMHVYLEVIAEADYFVAYERPCSVRGYHVNKAIWMAAVGDLLLCEGCERLPC